MSSPYRWVIQALLFLIYFSFGVSWLAFAPLLSDIERTLHLTHASAGLLISAVSVAKAFVPLLAGMLAARLGLRRALTVGAVLGAVALLAPLATSFQALLAVRFLFGVGGAIVVTLMGAAMMAWFPRRELPLVNGLNNVAVNTGVTVALFATVPLAARLGWQHTLLLYGFVSACLAVLWIFLGRDAAPLDRPGPEASSPQILGEVLRRRETWLIAAGFTGPLALYLSLNTWLPAYYEAAFHLTRQAASATTGLFNLVGIPAALAGGWITARLGLRRPLIVGSGLLMPLAAAVMILTPDPTARAAGAAALGASFFLYVSPLFTVPMELPGLTSRHVAVLSGVVYSVAYGASFLSPLIVGWMRDAAGSFVPGLLLFAATSSVLAMAGGRLPETGPRRMEQATDRILVLSASAR